MRSHLWWLVDAVTALMRSGTSGLLYPLLLGWKSFSFKLWILSDVEILSATSFHRAYWLCPLPVGWWQSLWLFLVREGDIDLCFIIGEAISEFIVFADGTSVFQYKVGIDSMYRAIIDYGLILLHWGCFLSLILSICCLDCIQAGVDVLPNALHPLLFFFFYGSIEGFV